MRHEAENGFRVSDEVPGNLVWRVFASRKREVYVKSVYVAESAGVKGFCEYGKLFCKQ